ncbi:molecular chaperone DnaJ [Erythrobacteraceae bacterium CFH 75059]|uniref:molecular chaperone DnaJ n=1 Tax=Qipengyuania thermophila TaxID=2509361 RepID=UPI001021B249|nr:molecular chaperone DnaJ [Qipengyuania thermophila]TCD05186.1 molecular chaperone DnaJ [Erythrobacteraceae bacterium CFH 75059]
MAVTDIDLYELLEVDRRADAAAIKAAYRKLAMRFHPDRNPGDAAAEARFKQISGAYEILKDPQKRAAYDRYGHAAFQQGGPAGGHDFADLGDIFETIFGNAFGGAGGAGHSRRGADLRYDLEITLEDAFTGKTTEITIEASVACDPCGGSGATPGTGTRRCQLCSGFGKVRAKQGFFVVERPCPTCHGRGELIEKPCRACGGEGRVDRRQALSVDIPPGVDTGTRIRLSGRGEAGANGAPAGDLYIFLHVKPHPVFERAGTNLHTQVPISFTTAALGGAVELPGMDGETITLDIPAGIQSGRQLRRRGEGMPVLQGRGRGDLVVEVVVETPSRLTREQRELLERFRELETGEECPQSRGFVDRLKAMLGT